MKTIKLLGIFLLFMLSQSCSKDPYNPGCGTKQTYYYTLTNSEINQSPYFTNPAFDTVSFASDKGDTLTFVKTKTDTTWYYEQGNGDPDCGYDKKYFQTIHNNYATIKGVGSFDMKHSKKINTGSLLNVISFKFNNTYFIVGGSQIGYNLYWTFKKVVNLKNRNFSDVIVLYPNSYDSLIAESYVNKDNGVIYFVDKIENINYTILN